MAQKSWDAVWERIRLGRHAVVIGLGSPPPAPADLYVLHVHCEEARVKQGILEVVQRHLEDLLDESLQPPGTERTPYDMGFRHRFLDDMPGPGRETLLVEACNRLADQRPGHIVLFLEALDVADSATVLTLTQMLQRPGWLRLPLLCTVRGAPQGLLAELIYVVCRDDGAAALFEIEGEAAAAETAPPFDWMQLPPEVLRVLRAGSVLGSTFEATLVARLLDEPVGAVLEKLQWAADAGAPLADREEGYFTLPAEAVSALQSRMLPSLLTFWHTRLGELLSHRPPERGAQRAVPTEVAEDLASAQPQAERPPVRPLTGYSDLFAPASQAQSPEEAPPVDAAPRPQDAEPAATVTDTEPPAMSARRTARRPAPATGPAADPTRAAAHWQAAGQTDAAVEHYLTAIREVAARGDTHRAYALIAQALQLLENHPPSSRHGLWRAQLLLERGRLQWHGVLAGAPFTLQDALMSLEAATMALPPDAPMTVRGECAAVMAGICYDLGDLGVLQRALALLAESSRRLLQANEPLLATRLLNDQAAIYVRLGDPVRATHLLGQSRELFTASLRQHPDDRVALEELAATDHLLARLPLHLPLRPGRETEATAAGMAHARAAEHTYQQLGQPYNLARVWETMGRLALQNRQLAEAKERLTAAHALQRQLGDVTGLARSTAALADLCAQAQQWEDALALLSDSIHLNVTKGSPIGLAFNRRALDALAQAITQATGAGATRFRAVLEELTRRLTEAETAFGRMGLPGEAA